MFSVNAYKNGSRLSINTQSYHGWVCCTEKGWDTDHDTIDYEFCMKEEVYGTENYTWWGTFCHMNSLVHMSSPYIQKFMIREHPRDFQYFPVKYKTLENCLYYLVHVSHVIGNVYIFPEHVRENPKFQQKIYGKCWGLEITKKLSKSRVKTGIFRGARVTGAEGIEFRENSIIKRYHANFPWDRPQIQQYDVFVHEL